VALTRVKTAVIGTVVMGRVHLEAVRRFGFVDVAAAAGTSMGEGARPGGVGNNPLAIGEARC